MPVGVYHGDGSQHNNGGAPASSADLGSTLPVWGAVGNAIKQPKKRGKDKAVKIPMLCPRVRRRLNLEGWAPFGPWPPLVWLTEPTPLPSASNGRDFSRTEVEGKGEAGLHPEFPIPTGASAVSDYFHVC